MTSNLNLMLGTFIKLRLFAKLVKFMTGISKRVKPQVVMVLFYSFRTNHLIKGWHAFTTIKHHLVVKPLRISHVVHKMLARQVSSTRDNSLKLR